jgi:galactose-1-phosphate uridylyltransferase
MEFERHTQEARLHSPLEDFAEVTETVEVRRDPLTGRTARIADGAFVMAEDYDIEAVVGDSEGCFFCPENVEEATPTYPDWMDLTRGSHGEATSFPNLNPYGRYANVVALTQAHFQPMGEFTSRQFTDGLTAALEFVTAAADHDDEVEYASVNMNFLRSAGSSIVHPHMQAVADESGTNQLRRLRDASRAYRAEEGSSYWADRRDEERNGDRWIGSTGPVDWFAAFAPKHHRHVYGVAEGENGFDVGREAVEGFGEGLTGVLASYAEAGLNAFNFALSLADDGSMPPVLSVVARSVFDEYYWADATYFTVLHDEGVVETPPEDYAEAASDWV